MSDRARSPVGVYVHFPWCLQKCPYCDFVSYPAPGRPSAPGGAPVASIDHDAYADAVLAELETRAAELAGPSRLASVFFGGGTPSLWEPRALGRVLAGVRAAFGATSDALEITVECNPSSLDEDRARALVDVGVERLSIGVQSFDDARLAHLGRLHDGAGARRAVEAAVRARVPRVSGDLIYALPGESPDEAAAEARELASLGVGHVSAYALTIEPGTRFGELARRGRLPLADEGALVSSFFAVDEALGALGLGHYEVSNFGRPGEESRHNLGYWRGDDYLGLGASAYGAVRRGAGHVRYRNEVDPARWLDAALARDRPRVEISAEALDPETRLRERIMLGLRLAAGLDLDAEAAALGVAPAPPERARAIERLVARGRLAREGTRLRVPRDAWIWVDDTAAALF